MGSSHTASPAHVRKSRLVINDQKCERHGGFIKLRRALDCDTKPSLLTVGDVRALIVRSTTIRILSSSQSTIRMATEVPIAVKLAPTAESRFTPGSNGTVGRRAIVCCVATVKSER